MADLNSLLSPEQWQQFEGAIRQVTDTFNRVPVTYHLTSGSLDRWQEDREHEGGIVHELLALVDYGVNSEDRSQSTPQGELDRGRCTLSFNVEYLRELGLIDENNVVAMNDTGDYFFVMGERYRVSRAVYDGQLQDKFALVVVEGVIDKF